MKIFKDNYDKPEFYSLMGKFFAERKYRKLMPYLANDDNTIWYISTNENDEVVGFINYVDKLGRANIGYCFIEDGYDDAQLLEHNLTSIVHNECCMKDMYVEVEKSWDKNSYITLGFEIYKESTNYWYLVKRCNRENFFK